MGLWLPSHQKLYAINEELLYKVFNIFMYNNANFYLLQNVEYFLINSLTAIWIHVTCELSLIRFYWQLSLLFSNQSKLCLVKKKYPGHCKQNKFRVTWSWNGNSFLIVSSIPGETETHFTVR